MYLAQKLLDIEISNVKILFKFETCLLLLKLVKHVQWDIEIIVHKLS